MAIVKICYCGRKLRIGETHHCPIAENTYVPFNSPDSRFQAIVEANAVEGDDEFDDVAGDMTREDPEYWALPMFIKILKYANYSFAIIAFLFSLFAASRENWGVVWLQIALVLVFWGIGANIHRIK